MIFKHTKGSTYHNRVYYVITVVLQSLDRLGSGYIGLRHDKFNVLVPNSLFVDHLILVIFRNGRLGSSGTSSTWNFSIMDPFFAFPQYLIDFILDWPCPFKVDLNFESINGFSACFSRILNQWIYDFFPRNFTFHFLEGSKVLWPTVI